MAVMDCPKIHKRGATNITASPPASQVRSASTGWVDGFPGRFNGDPLAPRRVSTTSICKWHGPESGSKKSTAILDPDRSVVTPKPNPLSARLAEQLASGALGDGVARTTRLPLL